MSVHAYKFEKTNRESINSPPLTFSLFPNKNQGIKFLIMLKSFSRVYSYIIILYVLSLLFCIEIKY